ncbi:MAG: methionine--tRNA ligase [Acidobacteria bacterium]|jgi:methionyl-tRNA synthetase|nr:methionine--tRNA ligase [Acidobacteriota bacterium]
MNETFYITTPIYYANSLPHLGHLYTTIIADVLTKYKKQRGFDTYFLTGTDEHGVNIQRIAEKNNQTPKEYVDYISGELKKIFAQFNLDSYDIFMRTTEPFHYEAVQNLWRKISENKTPKGNETIYKGFYEGWFCPNCAEFKTETEYELKEGEDVPLCLIHERPLDKVSEESYFFRLSDYDEFLLETIGNNPNLVRPESRQNEVLSFIRSGLQDLSISREKKSVSWGVPVPDDENHVIYLWVDALSNYITAIGYGNEERKNVGFEKYWQNVTHLVGKDISRQHTVYWFSILKAAKLELPKTVFAHGLWLDVQGRKMSKTIGNVIDLQFLYSNFSIDAIRYFLLRDMVFGQDGKFGYENLIDRTNADLASGLGNLSSRTLSMINKYRDGLIPSGKIQEHNYLYGKRAGINPDEQELVSVLEHARDEYLRKFDNFEFSLALETLWSVIARIDKMISDAKPWELIKDENQAETLNAVLYRATETLRWLCVLLYPVMPKATREIYAQIGLSEDVSQINPENLTYGELLPGTKIGETQAVFPRVDKTKIMNEINEQSAVNSQQSGEESNESRGGNETVEKTTTESANNGEQQINEEINEEKNFIAIEDFLKVELRVGEIKVAERIPKADKLLRFEIDLGEEKPRQILAGLAEYYEPEKLIGRKVVVVVNLKPRKMRGLESQGMICAASLENSDDTPALASFLEDVKIGARLK